MSDTAQPIDVVRLTSVENSEKAFIIRQALEDDGIYARVLGDNLEAGFGDLPGLGAEIWVRRPDLERAKAFLAKHESA